MASVLTGITWDHPRGYDCIVAASKAFLAETGTSVVWDKRSLQAFADAPILDMAEHYDFIVLDHPHVGQIAETGALLPLPHEHGRRTSLGGSDESYLWNGTCWAYALDASCQMAVCRPDLGSEVPGTWEHFLAPDAKEYRSLTPLLPVDAFDMLMTLVAGRGEDDLPRGPDAFVTADNGEYALGVLRALYKLGPEEQVGMNPIGVLEVLSETDDFLCAPCLFGYVNYVRPGFRRNRLRYVDLPVSEGQSGSRSILGGAGIGVSARTEQPETAIAFANWITSEDVQSGVYLQNSGQPANRETWIAQCQNEDVAPFFSGAFRTIDTAWTRPRDTWFLDFVDDVCDIMPEFFIKDVPSDTFLAQINRLYRHHTGGL